MQSTTLFLIAVAVILLSAVPVAVILKDVLPGVLQRRSGFDRIENRIYILHAEAQDIQERVKGLSARRNSQASDRNRLESDIRKMEKAIADLAAQPPLFVHEVGDPHTGLTRFTVSVTQDKASSAARAAGERAQVNQIWRHANVAEVWASSFEEARQMVEVAFPFKLGFEKSFQKTPPAQEGATKAPVAGASLALKSPPAGAGGTARSGVPRSAAVPRPAATKAAGASLS